MAAFLGFGVKAKRDLFIRTEIHIFEGFFFLEDYSIEQSHYFQNVFGLHPKNFIFCFTEIH